MESTKDDKGSFIDSVINSVFYFNYNNIFLTSERSYQITKIILIVIAILTQFVISFLILFNITFYDYSLFYYYEDIKHFIAYIKNFITLFCIGNIDKARFIVIVSISMNMFHLIYGFSMRIMDRYYITKYASKLIGIIVYIKITFLDNLLFISLYIVSFSLIQCSYNNDFIDKINMTDNTKSLISINNFYSYYEFSVEKQTTFGIIFKKLMEESTNIISSKGFKVNYPIKYFDINEFDISQNLSLQTCEDKVYIILPIINIFLIMLINDIKPHFVIEKLHIPKMIQINSSSIFYLTKALFRLTVCIAYSFNFHPKYHFEIKIFSIFLLAIVHFISILNFHIYNNKVLYNIDVFFHTINLIFSIIAIVSYYTEFNKNYTSLVIISIISAFFGFLVIILTCKLQEKKMISSFGKLSKEQALDKLIMILNKTDEFTHSKKSRKELLQCFNNEVNMDYISKDKNINDLSVNDENNIYNIIDNDEHDVEHFTHSKCNCKIYLSVLKQINILEKGNSINLKNSFYELNIENIDCNNNDNKNFKLKNDNNDNSRVYESDKSNVLEDESEDENDDFNQNLNNKTSNINKNEKNHQQSIFFDSIHNIEPEKGINRKISTKKNVITINKEILEKIETKVKITSDKLKEKSYKNDNSEINKDVLKYYGMINSDKIIYEKDEVYNKDQIKESFNSYNTFKSFQTIEEGNGDLNIKKNFSSYKKEIDEYIKNEQSKIENYEAFYEIEKSEMVNIALYGICLCISKKLKNIYNSDDFTLINSAISLYYNKNSTVSIYELLKIDKLNYSFNYSLFKISEDLIKLTKKCDNKSKNDLQFDKIISFNKIIDELDYLIKESSNEYLLTWVIVNNKEKDKYSDLFDSSKKILRNKLRIDDIMKSLLYSYNITNYSLFINYVNFITFVVQKDLTSEIKENYIVKLKENWRNYILYKSNSITNYTYQDLENLGVLIVSSDVINHARITYSNLLISDFLKYKSEELIRKNVNILIPDIIAEKHDLFIKRYVETNHSNILNKDLKLFMKTKIGYIICVDIHIKPMLNFSDGINFISLVRRIKKPDPFCTPDSQYYSDLNFIKELFLNKDYKINTKVNFYNDLPEKKADIKLFNEKAKYRIDQSNLSEVKIDDYSLSKIQFIPHQSISIILTTGPPNYFLIGVNKASILQLGIPLNVVFDSQNRNSNILRIFDLFPFLNYNQNELIDNEIDYVEYYNTSDKKRLSDGGILFLDSKDLLSLYQDYIEMAMDSKIDFNFKLKKGTYTDLNKKHLVHISFNKIFFNEGKSSICCFKIIKLFPQPILSKLMKRLKSKYQSIKKEKKVYIKSFITDNSQKNELEEYNSEDEIKNTDNNSFNKNFLKNSISSIKFDELTENVEKIINEMDKNDSNIINISNYNFKESWKNINYNTILVFKLSFLLLLPTIYFFISIIVVKDNFIRKYVDYFKYDKSFNNIKLHLSKVIYISQYKYLFDNDLLVKDADTLKIKEGLNSDLEKIIDNMKVDEKLLSYHFNSNFNNTSTNVFNNITRIFHFINRKDNDNIEGKNLLVENESIIGLNSQSFSNLFIVDIKIYSFNEFFNGITTKLIDLVQIKDWNFLTSDLFKKKSIRENYFYITTNFFLSITNMLCLCTNSLKNFIDNNIYGGKLINIYIILSIIFPVIAALISLFLVSKFYRMKKKTLSLFLMIDKSYVIKSIKQIENYLNSSDKIIHFKSVEDDTMLLKKEIQNNSNINDSKLTKKDNNETGSIIIDKTPTRKKITNANEASNSSLLMIKRSKNITKNKGTKKSENLITEEVSFIKLNDKKSEYDNTDIQEKDEENYIILYNEMNDDSDIRYKLLIKYLKIFVKILVLLFLMIILFIIFISFEKKIYTNDFDKFIYVISSRMWGINNFFSITSFLISQNLINKCSINDIPKVSNIKHDFIELTKFYESTQFTYLNVLNMNEKKNIVKEEFKKSEFSNFNYFNAADFILNSNDSNNNIDKNNDDNNKKFSYIYKENFPSFTSAYCSYYVYFLNFIFDKENEILLNLDNSNNDFKLYMKYEKDLNSKENFCSILSSNRKDILDNERTKYEEECINFFKTFNLGLYQNSEENSNLGISDQIKLVWRYYQHTFVKLQNDSGISQSERFKLKTKEFSKLFVLIKNYINPSIEILINKSYDILDSKISHQKQMNMIFLGTFIGLIIVELVLLLFIFKKTHNYIEIEGSFYELFPLDESICLRLAHLNNIY